VARGSGLPRVFARGKSGLRREECWLTARRGNPTASATESRPPVSTGKGERVR